MDTIKLYVDREWIKASKNSKNQLFRTYLHLLHPKLIEEYLTTIVRENSSDYYMIDLTPELKHTFKRLRFPSYSNPRTNMVSFIEYAILLNEAPPEVILSHPIMNITTGINRLSFYNITTGINRSAFYKYTPFETMKYVISHKRDEFNGSDIMYHITHYRNDINLDILDFIETTYPRPEPYLLDTLWVKINDKIYTKIDIYDKLVKNCPQDIHKVEFIGYNSSSLIHMMSSYEELEEKKDDLDYQVISSYYRTIQNINLQHLKKFIFKYPTLGWNWNDITTSCQITINDVIQHPHLPWRYKLLSRNENITEEMIDAHPEINWTILQVYQTNPNIGWKKANFSSYNNYVGYRKSYEDKIRRDYYGKIMSLIL